MFKLIIPRVIIPTLFMNLRDGLNISENLIAAKYQQK